MRSEDGIHSHSPGLWIPGSPLRAPRNDGGESLCFLPLAATGPASAWSHIAWMWAISASKRSRNSRAGTLRVRRAGWITTNSACSGGSTIGLTTSSPCTEVVHRNDARQHGEPVGARDEFERADHRVHFQHGGDLDAVRLEIGLEVAASNIVRARHHDLQRGAVREPHRRERREPALRPRQQHLPVADQQSRLQPDPSLERRDQREIELVRQHHVGQHAAVALEHVQAHIGMARRRSPRASAPAPHG